MGDYKSPEGCSSGQDVLVSNVWVLAYPLVQIIYALRMG